MSARQHFYSSRRQSRLLFGALFFVASFSRIPAIAPPAVPAQDAPQSFQLAVQESQPMATAICPGWTWTMPGQPKLTQSSRYDARAHGRAQSAHAHDADASANSRRTPRAPARSSRSFAPASRNTRTTTPPSRRLQNLLRIFRSPISLTNYWNGFLEASLRSRAPDFPLYKKT